MTIDKGIIFLNLDKAEEICKLCKKNKIKNRKIWNKKQILEKIAKGEIVIFLIKKNDKSLNYISYKNYSCILAHYNKECMKDCIENNKNVEKFLKDYNFWSYGKCPKIC